MHQRGLKLIQDQRVLDQANYKLNQYKYDHDIEGATMIQIFISSKTLTYRDYFIGIPNEK